VVTPLAADDARSHLKVYLRDHFAGSTAGLALVRRCRRANHGTSWDVGLAAIEREITEDRESLRALMDRLDVEPSRIKSLLGSLAEMLGRLKSNGQSFAYSPLSRLVELEGLAAGIHAKRQLWRALRHVDGIDESELDRLIERATDQLGRVTGLHDGAAAEVWGTGRAAVGAAP
jgi:hypothetical protein